ncbi:response regulator [Kiritimatiellota bacterium B12222]|nr:response regulator [Kiritimatiellota bacterium B12222]
MTPINRPLQVLVLDDDDKILRLLKIFLRQLGYQVTTAPNGREGVQMMLETCFDLIIADIQMPVVDGYQFAKEALRLWPWEKIILCTGRINSEVKQRASDLGITTLLEKPLSFNTLESAIQSVCGSKNITTAEAGLLELNKMGVELSHLRKFTHQVTAHNHFGKILSDYPQLLFKVIPCAAAGIFGIDGDYSKLCVYSEDPVDPLFLEEISTKIQSHIEFFSGNSLPGMPKPEVKALKPNNAWLQSDTHYALMTPISGQRDAKGILFLILEGTQSAPPPQLNYLNVCAHHLSTLLELTDSFQRSAIFHPLTGLYTRAYLDEQIQAAWDLAVMNKHSMGLLSLDLNEFKAINEQYGYPAGDEILKSIATLITSHLQPTEIAAVRGGDEFCILMPDVTTERAQSLARAIVAGIENLTPVIDSVPVKLSASAGVAITLDQHGITSSSQLVECAEQARFVAKRSDKISISSWTELKASGQASFNLHSVLVVDDDPQICLLIQRLLNKNMYEVMSATSVAEAMSLLEQGNRFEVMLTDLGLPLQDGTEMIRLGQKVDPNMISIVISGNISNESEQQLRQRGAFDVLKKPFVPEQLRTSVGNAVDQYTRSVRKNTEA